MQNSDGHTEHLTLDIAASEPEKVTNLPAPPKAVPLWLIADQKCLQLQELPISEETTKYPVALAACDSANPAQRWHIDEQSRLRNEFRPLDYLRAARHFSEGGLSTELAACDAAGDKKWTYSEKRFQTQEGAPLWVHLPNGRRRDDNALWSWGKLR